MEAKKNCIDILFIDVRDKYERDAEPVIEYAGQLSRGMLEFYAEKEGPYFNTVLKTEKNSFILYFRYSWRFSNQEFERYGIRKCV